MEEYLFFLTNGTTESPNASTTAAPNCIPAAWGYITAAIAVFMFGSNFIPVKKYETGDGLFFQWIMCNGIMLSGIILQLIRGVTAEFHPIVLVGGILWTCGNITVVPIIKTIGMGLGLCIWGMVNLLSGWATGRFGLFGVYREDPDNSLLNYLGVALAVSSAFVFSFVKNEMTPVEDRDNIHEKETLVSPGSSYGSTSESLYNSNSPDVLVFNRRSSSVNQSSSKDRRYSQATEGESFVDRLSPGTKRAVGIGLCLIAGMFYGQTFTGAIYMQEQSGASKNPLDYVFPCFCGIYMASTFWVVLYTIIMKNMPKVYPQVILPGIISGIMWSVATSCWFVANKVLSEPVAFPIITAFPSVVASLWGVLLFKEIKGKRNILILLLGFVISGTGITLAGLSKHPNSGC